MEERATHIHLVRHGEVHNPDQILYGRLPGFRLSANGLRQAQAAGRILQDKPMEVLFASPLLRARQTAAEILKYHKGLKLRISSLLNEVHTAFEGRPGAEIDALNGDVYTGADACFEQPEDIVARMQQFILQMRSQYAGRQVVAVTHGDLIVFTILWAKAFDLTPKNKTRLKPAGFPKTYPAPASITTLTYGTPSAEERPQVEYIQP